MHYPEKVLSLNPLAYWRLNEKWVSEMEPPPVVAEDSSPNNHHGQYVTSGMPHPAMGLFGQPSLLPFPDTDASTILGPLDSEPIEPIEIVW